MIVACASFHGLDIVFSSDNRTMKGKRAIKAYNYVNMKELLRTPNFLDYTDVLDIFRSK